MRVAGRIMFVRYLAEDFAILIRLRRFRLERGRPVVLH